MTLSTLAPARADELRRDLERIARRHAGRDDLAAEAVQDVLVLLWRRATPPPDLRRWLRAAVLHRCRHHLRSQTRAERRERLAARGEGDALADPVCHLCADELRERIEAALTRLPARSRRVLTLREQGHDYADIAERLDVPIGTVRSSLHRARATLRESLADWIDA